MSISVDDTRTVSISGNRGAFEICISLKFASTPEPERKIKPANGSLRHITRGWSVVLEGTLEEIVQLRDLINEILSEAAKLGFAPKKDIEL